MTAQQWPDTYLAQCSDWLARGGTYGSIARVAGVSPETVRSRVRRYRARFGPPVYEPTPSEEQLGVAGVADLRDEPSAAVHDLTGRRSLLLGCVSDTHCGSKHFRADLLGQFVDSAYRRGVRHIVHAGDIVAGYHKKWRTELLCSSMDDQTDVAIEQLPERDGLSWYAISGNHGGKFHQAAGVLPSAYFRQRFAEAGRTDVRFLGDNRARLELGGFTIGLQHPGSGGAENLEASVYRYLRKTPDWHALDLYFCGHWHRYCRADRFGKHCWSLPCFEHGGSVWGAGLAGDTDVGGLIVEVEQDGRQTTVREELVLYR